jgi:hypothetical protein
MRFLVTTPGSSPNAGRHLFRLAARIGLGGKSVNEKGGSSDAITVRPPFELSSEVELRVQLS